MSAPPFLDKLPRPVVFGLYGTVAGLLVALTFGELVWWMFRPAPNPLALLAPQGEVDRMRPPVHPNSGRLAVTASPRLSVYPGGTNTIAVRVARDRFEGPVSFVFAAPPAVQGNPVTVHTGETSAQTQLTISPTARIGKHRLTALATATANGQVLSESAVIEVTVLPRPPAQRLAVSLSPKVQAYQRGRNQFTVKIARGDFDDDVTVIFNRLPDGVTIPPVVIPAMQTEATADVLVEGSTKTGRHIFNATARGGPRAPTATASTETALEVLASPRLPVDVVLVLDCTGSMGKVVKGLSQSLDKFDTELIKAQLDARFGLVGFQDTTLGQPLKIARFGDDRMTADIDRFRNEAGRLRLGGGGGDGSSSLDGLAEAADSPFRESTNRVLLLVTDDAPKKVDGRVRGTADAVKILKDKKIDQVHIAALPEHKRLFEPVLEGARGKFFDLKAAVAADDFDKFATDLGRAVWESLPVRPDSKPVASAPAAPPVLPPGGFGPPPALPPGTEPDEPRIEPLVPTPGVTEPTGGTPVPEPKARKTLAAVAWVVVVAGLVCLLLLLGQMTFLPGGLPPAGVGAIGYGCGLVVGLISGALGFVALEAVATEFVGRLAAGCGLGLGIGLLVPLPQLLLYREPAPRSERTEEPLDLDEEPAPAEPEEPKPAVAIPVKPNIAPPKPADGCPGCGRTIPGAVGARYCMLCDNTF